MASHLEVSLADGRMHTANNMPLHCSKLTACSVATRHIQMYAPAHMEEGAENHPNSAWLSKTPLGVAYPAARSPSVWLCEALPPTAKALLQHLPQLPAAGTTLAAVTTLIAVMHRHFVVLRLEATCKALSVGLGNRRQTQRVGAAAALVSRAPWSRLSTTAHRWGGIRRQRRFSGEQLRAGTKGLLGQLRTENVGSLECLDDLE